MHTENNNMKHKWFQGLFPPREEQYGLKVQQWDLQSRSLSALMITRNSFSANMYFKVNKSILLMLQAHLIRIWNYSIIAYLESSGVFLDYWQPVDIYLWLYGAVTIIHCCAASGSGSYLSTAYRRVYICLCDSPIFHRPGNVKNTILKEREKKRQYTHHNSFNYSCQGNCQQMLFFVCFVYFTVSHSKARLLLCMTREMTISGRDGVVYTNNWRADNGNQRDLLTCRFFLGEK